MNLTQVTLFNWLNNLQEEIICLLLINRPSLVRHIKIIHIPEIRDHKIVSVDAICTCQYTGENAC